MPGGMGFQQKSLDIIKSKDEKEQSIFLSKEVEEKLQNNTFCGID